MPQKEYIQIPTSVKTAGDNTLWVTMSTDDMDRHGEEVSQNWNLESFLGNPVVLNGHQYNDTTEAIGRVDVLIQKEHSLEGKIRFAVEENPKANIIFDLYKGGFLNAFSVGFIPGEEENELLELSAVTVPANALALAKAKGVDVGEMEADYSELTVEQLKGVLKEKGISTTGNKKELVGRLEDEEEVEEKEEEVEQKSPTCRMEDETKEECVNRKIPELIEEGMEQDQAVAVANEMCEESCEELEQNAEEIKALYEEKAGRVLSAATKKKIQTAKEALEQLLTADEKSVEEDENEEVEEEVVVTENKIKSAIKGLHKELDETHEDNLSIKKKKLHKALRLLSRKQ